jgi:hypothetical protein
LRNASASPCRIYDYPQAHAVGGEVRKGVVVDVGRRPGREEHRQRPAHCQAKLGLSAARAER